MSETPRTRLALATALYRDEAVTLGRAAKIAGMTLAEFMQHLSRNGIPVVAGTPESVREDAATLDAWLNCPPSSPRTR